MIAMFARKLEKVMGSLGSAQVHHIRLATMCSGTDIAVDVLLRWLRLLCEDFGSKATVQVDYCFACELDRRKRQFLLQFTPKKPRHLFADVMTLSGQTSLCYLTNRPAAVPSVDWVIGGFECDSVSMLNTKRAEFARCIDGKEGSTGQTFSGILDYAKTHQPRALLLENVRSLGMAVTAVTAAGLGRKRRHMVDRDPVDEGDSDNLTSCVPCLPKLSERRGAEQSFPQLAQCEVVDCHVQVTLLEAAGCHVHVQEVQANQYGTAQRRSRLYLLCCRHDLMPPTTTAEAQTFDSKCREFFCAARLPCPPLKEFLLPTSETLPWLEKLHHHQELARSQRGSRGHHNHYGHGSYPRWKQLHKSVFEQHALPFPSSDLPVKCSHFLTERERSVVQFLCHIHRFGTPDSDTLSADVSQSITRVPRSSTGTPCVVPNSTIVIADLQMGLVRPLVPPEHLLLQGFDARAFPNPAALHGFGWAEVNNLAGNAFSGHSVAVSLLAMLAMFPLP